MGNWFCEALLLYYFEGKECLVNMYKFLNEVDASRHDAFVKNNPLCNLLQSSGWGEVKENWNRTIIGIEEDGELVASALVLIKRLPFYFCVMYIPRGPVLNYENEDLVLFFMKELRNWASSQHALFVKMDPGVHCRDYLLEEKNNVPLNSKTIKIMNNMSLAGAIHQGFVKNLNDSIQPRFQANVYLKKGFQDLLTKSAKKALSITKKNHLLVERCGKEGVNDFEHIMHCTERRKGISLRNAQYFDRLMHVYGNDAVIILIKLPITLLHEEVCVKLAETEKALADCNQNSKKKIFILKEQYVSYAKQKKDLEEYQQNYGEEVVIAGALCIRFGTSSELLYAGMDERFKRYMPSYLAFTECMKWSFEKKCLCCNLGGIEGTLKGGLIQFKANFSPVVNELIGEFDLPISFLYYVVNFLYKKIYKKLKNN